MLNQNTFRILVVFVLFSSLSMSGCSPTTPAAPSQVTLRLAVIPVLETLPLYVAQNEGLFNEQGLEVEFIPAASAPVRDQLIASGEADGMINEVLTTMFNNREQVQVQIVRFARTATAEAPLFRILASAKSGITSAHGLKGVEIGISQGTVIEYLTDRLLQAEGLSPEEIKTVAVPGITDRMALLESGELSAAMLPDPLSSLAIQQGAVVALDDTSHPEYSFSTITFRKAVIDQHPEAIRAFLSAMEEAVNMINADPTRWDAVLAEQNLVPAPLLETFELPKFATAGVPNQAQWDDVLEWAKGKGLLDKDLSYAETVTDAYLP
ncbi:MAG: ABC transporter substrate-binding protein [Anaerolineales bacterium]|nr:ABC transporter substrate-binding protein [Anaerolineales bacterium]